MNHTAAHDLLAPLSLDALDADLRAEVEAHVATCAQCQRELDDLREVATALGTTGLAAPEGLWERIAARLDERPVPIEPPPLVFARDAAPRALGRTRRALAAVSLVAAAAVVALAVGLAHESARAGSLASALASARRGVVATALATPGHRVVTLTTASGQGLATFVLLRDGRGYLVRDTLAPLGAGRTYQLWGIVAGRPVSIGVLGRAPRAVAFTLADVTPSALGITVEPRGGSLTPAPTMVASGAV